MAAVLMFEFPSGRRKKPVGSSSKPYGRLNRAARAIEAEPTGSCRKPVGLLRESSRAIGAKPSGLCGKPKYGVKLT